MYKLASVIAFLLIGTVSAQATYSPAEELQPSTYSNQASCVTEIASGGLLKVEIVVMCNGRSAMFTYSPIDKMYCDSKMRCMSSLKPLAANYFLKLLALDGN